MTLKIFKSPVEIEKARTIGAKDKLKRKKRTSMQMLQNKADEIKKIVREEHMWRITDKEAMQLAEQPWLPRYWRKNEKKVRQELAKIREE